jgi:hypothetical protein
MHETDQKIISIFRREANELSTSQILELINSKYANLRNRLNLTPKENSKKIKQEIAKLHRRTLHHINKLVNLGILKLVKHGERGEKFFSLNLSDNEEIISTGIKKRILVSKPSMPVMPIEGYEQKGIVTKYEPATWIDRLNSVIIRCEKVNSTEQLYKILNEDIFSSINDAVCLDSFEQLINKSNITEFLEKINSNAEDYGKKISIIISISKIKNKKNFQKFLNSLETELSNLIFIFNINSNDLQEHFDIFNRIINIYARKKLILYIKNKNLYEAPYFLGRIGPYCIDKKEWFSDEVNEQICIACSQLSIIVDVNRFYLEYGLDTKKFSELLLNISKSILSANSLQRRKSEEYFKNIIALNSKKEFLDLSKNYIRFWNYGLSQPNIDPELVISMINEAKKKVDNFSIAEETIYNSCGMPTRFKLAFSCAFEQADEKLSPAKYTHLEIKGFEDLYKTKIKKQIIAREIISEIFDGGNDITFHKTGILEPDEIIREVSTILNTYKLPFFSYNFKKIKGNLKLTQFVK